MTLSAETDWLLFLGSPGSSFPTFSPILSLNQITLKKGNSYYISFSAEKVAALPKRGYFDHKERCRDDDKLSETIKCYKRCYTERLKVILGFSVSNPKR